MSFTNLNHHCQILKIKSPVVFYLSFHLKKWVFKETELESEYGKKKKSVGMIRRNMGRWVNYGALKEMLNIHT